MKKAWVVKFGGSLLSDDGARRGFLKDAAALAKKRALVLVHGGGPEINAALDRMGVKSMWVNGRRVTDEEAMGVVEMVLSGQVNKRLVGELSRLGVKAVGLSGRDGGLMTAKPVPDLGRVGTPSKVDPSVLKTLLADGFLPVVSSVASGPGGEALNVNADEAAAALAAALKAERLIYLTDVPGVLDAAKNTIPVVKTRKDLEGLIASGVITGGMIPKTRSCREAIKKGVGEVDIVDGRAGLLEMKGTRLLP
jgi:acetylglutamate kinase